MLHILYVNDTSIKIKHYNNMVITICMTHQIKTEIQEKTPVAHLVLRRHLHFHIQDADVRSTSPRPNVATWCQFGQVMPSSWDLTTLQRSEW